MQAQGGVNSRVDKTLDDIKSQLTLLTQALTLNEKGKFPAQPQPNPTRQVSNVENATSTSGNHEQLNAITTLRSGKVIDKTIPLPNPSVEPLGEYRGDEKNESLGEDVRGGPGEKIEKEKEKPREEKPRDVTINGGQGIIHAPFPHRLTKSKNELLHSEMYEVFKQVKINIPLLDAIKQVPSYAKFLKDLCTIKRRHHVKERAFMNEQASAILQFKTPPKYKDPGCPTISCYIGDHRIDQALLDLGASVNLLPYSVYQQLGLGELRPT